jgi:hypothetical protein
MMIPDGRGTCLLVDSSSNLSRAPVLRDSCELYIDGRNVVDVEAEFARHTVIGLPRIATHRSVEMCNIGKLPFTAGSSIILEHFSIWRVIV